MSVSVFERKAETRCCSYDILVKWARARSYSSHHCRQIVLSAILFQCGYKANNFIAMTPFHTPKPTIDASAFIAGEEVVFLDTDGSVMPKRCWLRQCLVVQ